MTKFKFIPLFTGTIIVLGGALYVKSISSTPQEPVRAEAPGRLKQWVQEAKSKGQTRLELHGRVFNRAQFTNLNDALTTFSLILVEPVNKKSVIEEDEVINTWYKFRIIDTLSQAKVTYNFSFMLPPPELLPLQPAEILVPVGGGTMTVDGIEVSSGEPGEPGLVAFDEKQQYLLFLCVDPAAKIGTADLGSAGVFLMRADDTLGAFNVDKHRVYDALQANSISELKRNLKHRR
ncbi:MAG TPA: hypothetical protein VF546_05695 [Pyrinomonadaceae bacterium]|jgi:hypothetical protein